jgi:hypothetical protein
VCALNAIGVGILLLEMLSEWTIIVEDFFGTEVHIYVLFSYQSLYIDFCNGYQLNTWQKRVRWKYGSPCKVLKGGIQPQSQTDDSIRGIGFLVPAFSSLD